VGTFVGLEVAIDVPVSLNVPPTTLAFLTSSNPNSSAAFSRKILVKSPFLTSISKYDMTVLLRVVV
jgi:hypothetical protein